MPVDKKQRFHSKRILKRKQQLVYLRSPSAIPSANSTCTASFEPSIRSASKHPRQLGWLIAVGIIAAIEWNLLMLAGTLVACEYRSIPTLQVSDFNSVQSTLLYDNQQTLFASLGMEQRINITYQQLPQSVVDAFLAIEDSRFFSHDGFDIPRFCKSAWEVVRHGSFVQGGSTLTMQLVKNTYFVSESALAQKTISRKLQEIVLAIQTEQVMDKKDILTAYLNKINFGGPARGIQTACEYYFQKDVSELNVNEAAFLAGVINLPNVYNPYLHSDLADQRKNTVLDLMAYHGYITEQEAAIWKHIPVVYTMQESRGHSYQYQAYTDTVVKECLNLTGRNPYDGDLIIYTNMDAKAQREAEKILNNETKIKLKKNMQAGFVVLEQDGRIAAIGGRRSYNAANLFNYATDARKQPGSSIKPILSYALAIEYADVTTDTVILDEPYYWPNTTFQVYNADQRYHGWIPIQQALSASYNIPAIKLLRLVEQTIGTKRIRTYLTDLGFDQTMADGYHLQYAIGGDTCTASPLQMGAAFHTLIQNGVYYQPYTIQRIEDNRGHVLYEHTDSGKQILSKNTSKQMKTLLKNNVARDYWLGTMAPLKDSYTVYAKTGTSDWGTSGKRWGIPTAAPKDLWVLAASKTHTVSVWVGYEQAGKNAYFTDQQINQMYPTKIANRMLDTVMK